MLLGLGFTRDYVIHSVEGGRSKEYLSALSTHLCRHIAQDEKVPFPAVDMLKTLCFNGALTEWTSLHGRSDSPPPIVPQGGVGPI